MFEPYLHGSLAFYTELESLLDRVERGDLKIAAVQERKLRQILTEFQLEAEYSRRSGAIVLNVGHPDTLAAKASFFRKLESWRIQTLARFRAANPSQVIAGRLLLPEVDSLLDLAANDWTRRVRLLRRSEDAAVRREASELLSERRIYAERWGSAKGYLEELGIESSFGKLENLAAEVMRVNRSAENFMVGFTSGASLQESTADAVTTFAATVAFNRNNISLSSTTHLRGLYNSVTIRLSEPLGMSHFMSVLTPKAERKSRGITLGWLWQVRIGVPDGTGIAPDRYAQRVATTLGGVTAQELLDRSRASMRRRGTVPSDQAFRDELGRIALAGEPVSSWPKEYDRINRRRGPSVSWAGNLGIHHNSREMYLPIPSTLLGSARAMASERRSKRAA